MKRALALSLALAAAGCVSPAKHRALESESKGWQAKASSLEARVKGLEAELGEARRLAAEAQSARDAALAQKSADAEAARRVESELRTRLTSAEERLKSAEAQVASLKGSVAELQTAAEAGKSESARRLAALVAEKDAAAQKLAEAQAAAADLRSAKDSEIAGLTRRLSAALEEKVALERAKASAEQEKSQLEAARARDLEAAKKGYEELASGLKAEIAAGEVKLTQLKDKLSLQLVDRILFDSGSAEIKAAGRKVLSRLGAVLNGIPDKDVRIEGHTDNVPIKAELQSIYTSNWELSTARATAVARYLQDHARVDPKRLVAAGYGEFRPVAPNDKAEGRALNRRIEIVLVAPQ